MPSLGLIALAFRRALPLVFAATLALLLFLATRAPEGVASGAASAELLHALRRQDAWTVLFLVGLPMLVVPGARLGARGQADWLVTTAAPRARLSLSLGLGVAAAALAVILLAALAAEVPLGPGGPAWRHAGTGNNAAALLTEADSVLRWSDDPGAGLCGTGTRLRLELTVAPGSGPAVDARLTARAAGGERASATARVSGRTGLELELPAGAHGPFELELARAGPGAVLVLPSRALEFLVPAASEHLASLALAQRALEVLCAAALLAFGLAAWMRPALAAGTVLALILPCCIGLSGFLSRAAPLLPGADLAEAWRQLGRGLVPASVSAGSTLVSLALALLGLALHARGLSDERRAS